MATYPLPQNVTSIATWGDYINLITGNLFGILVLVAAMIIMYSVLALRYSTKTSISATSFTMAILAILWRFAGMINDIVMFTFVSIAILGIVYLQFTKD